MPPDGRQAFAEITQAPLAKPQNFDEDTMKSLQAKAVFFLSPDAGDVVVVSAEKNPLMINQHETFEVTVAFRLYGEHYQQSVLFVNLPDTQLAFRFLSRSPTSRSCTAIFAAASVRFSGFKRCTLRPATAHGCAV